MEWWTGPRDVLHLFLPPLNLSLSQTCPFSPPLSTPSYFLFLSQRLSLPQLFIHLLIDYFLLLSLYSFSPPPLTRIFAFKFVCDTIINIIYIVAQYTEMCLYLCMNINIFIVEMKVSCIKIYPY